jgi:hypothetical protein
MIDSVFRDPKTPSAWVELDFHARQRRFKQWKRRLNWTVLIASVLVVGGSIAASVVGRRTTTWYQAAPVSTSHAIFNDDCGKCHTMEFQTARRFWPANADLHTVPDAKCRTCHPGASEHHGDVMKDQAACVTCHREHQGHEQLARVSDMQCLTCHRNLKARYAGTSHADVTGFPQGHPDFSVWEKKGNVRVTVRLKPKELPKPGDLAQAEDQLKTDGTRVFIDVPVTDARDPGLIRFNHNRHLNLVDEELQGQKRPQCVDCHQLDDAKQYMKPISHEQHCARCHARERTFLLTGKFEGPDLNRRVKEFAATPLPHTDPRTIRDILDGRLRRFATIDATHVLELADVTEEDRPWVKDKVKQNWKIAERGDRPPLFRIPQFVEPQVAFGERMLYDRGVATQDDRGTRQSCGKCHDMTPESAKRSREKMGEWEDKVRPFEELPDYARPKLPVRWLLHAGFSHGAHLQLDCQACHQQAAASKDTSDILLPKLAACAECHSSSAPNGGARHDCVVCHRYHEHSYVSSPRFGTIEDALKK